MSAYANPGLESLQPVHHGRWEPRRALTLSAARRRTATVRGLRLAFTIAAGAIVLLLAVQLWLGSRGAEQSQTEAVSADIRMTNPRFTGRDSSLVPYVVTADFAVRRQDGPDGITELQHPRVDYDLLNATTDSSRVLAETGRYDAPNRILELNSDVNLSTRSGYSFASEHARIFLREERIEGDEPVRGTGPMGSIRADRYEINQGGDHISFDGSVRTVLIQDRTTSSLEEGSE
ncbi:LPS export ABC transporter periplasmic protein LptC [Maricaulis sp. CAU 1757]